MCNSPWFGGLYKARRSQGIRALDQFSALHYAKVTSLYTFVTALLGYTPNKHEGKITGLAAYGKPTEGSRELLRKWFEEEFAEIESTMEWVFAYNAIHSPMLFINEAKIQPFRDAAECFSREELAATVQEFAEAHVLSLLDKAKELGWESENICLAGGLFANVKINQAVIENGFKHIFVAPPMTDDGTALGAAWHVLSQQPSFNPPPLNSMYLGPEYSTEQIKWLLRTEEIQFSLHQHPETEVASLLASGAVVAIFQGAMEFGPRALGNRSILAQAIEHDINLSLNDRLNRTEFMPFAPVSRVEDAAECYVGIGRVSHAAEFMTVTVDCTEKMKTACPAVVHVDGTARPQLVSAQSNPFIHAVLTIYKDQTGKAALVNTSFNIHEEPIVCSPQDALKGFFEAGLDYIYFGEGVLVSYNQNAAVAIQYLQNRSKQVSPKVKVLTEVVRSLQECLLTEELQLSEKERVIQQLKHVVQQPQENFDEQLQNKDREIQNKDRALQDKDRALQDKDRALQDKDRALQDKDRELQDKESVVQEQKDAITGYRRAYNCFYLFRIITNPIAAVWKIPSVEPCSSVEQDDPVNQDLVIKQLHEQLQDKEVVIREQAVAIRVQVASIKAQAIVIKAYRSAFSCVSVFSSFVTSTISTTKSIPSPLFRLLAKARRRTQTIFHPRLGDLNQYQPRLPTKIHNSQVSLKLDCYPKVSIVTPSFEQGGYIERTLRSVLDQNYQNLEYFVQDGGSTDNTVSILNSYEAQLSGWVSETDEGQSQAINRGFSRTDGEIMAWLNSDDLLLPGAIASVVDFFNRNPEIDVVYGNRLLIDENDMEIGRWIMPGHDSNVLSWADYIPQETMFWRRCIWEKAGGEIDESFRFAMDWDLLIRFREAGARFAHIPRFIGAFRIHAHQKTSAAINETGYKEMDRIRARLHGRVPSHFEIRKAITPFLIRHVAVDMVYRVRTRLVGAP
jgi:predicted NodU family carbamoyl transferase/GT2 family glycosyltransferase